MQVQTETSEKTIAGFACWFPVLGDNFSGRCRATCDAQGYVIIAGHPSIIEFNKSVLIKPGNLQTDHDNHNASASLKQCALNWLARNIKLAGIKPLNLSAPLIV